MTNGAGGFWKTGLGVLALFGLAACITPDAPSPDDSAPQDATAMAAVAPQARPAPAPIISVTPSQNSRDLARHYRRVENDLVARGLLRTDGGGPDTQFTDTMLARNFVRIALFDEFIATPTGLRAQQTVSQLRRWEKPVRFSVEFGSSVPDEQRAEDGADVTRYVERLNRITGHPMQVVDTDPNFRVLILNEDDRLGYEARLRALVPGIDDTSVQAFISVPRDTLCLVLAFSQSTAPGYSQAIALIRGEHPDLMRLACIHEELAQGLGLANDSPQARPSIFNDDEEFGLLTTHDELLLKMLYDDRLQPGMSAAEAAPIARVIARDLMNSGPS